MNTIVSFIILIVITVSLSALITGYLRPYLHKVLVDLCGTEERAQFWSVFSTIVLIGFPCIFALNYKPAAASSEELFFEIAGRISGTLAGFLFALIGLGMVVSVFALFAPRTATKAESK